MHFRIQDLSSKNQDEIGFVNISDFSLIDNTSEKITQLLHDCELVKIEEEIQLPVPSIFFYYETNEGEIVSLVCCSVNLAQLPEDIRNSYSQKNSLYIYFMCTKEQYRNRGLARSLLTNTILASVKDGIENVLIDVNIKNRIAYDFYKKYGFVKVGTMIEKDGEILDILLIN